MGKATEPPDNIGMFLGIVEVIGIAGFAEEVDATQLVGQMLRMHERHVEKFQQGFVDTRIRAAGYGAARNLQGRRVT